MDRTQSIVHVSRLDISRPNLSVIQLRLDRAQHSEAGIRHAVVQLRMRARRGGGIRSPIRSPRDPGTAM